MIKVFRKKMKTKVKQFDAVEIDKDGFVVVIKKIINNKKTYVRFTK